jgi:hypothetical protein
VAVLAVTMDDDDLTISDEEIYKMLEVFGLLHGAPALFDRVFQNKNDGANGRHEFARRSRAGVGSIATRSVEVRGRGFERWCASQLTCLFW